MRGAGRWTAILVSVLFCTIRFHIKRKSSRVVSWGGVVLGRLHPVTEANSKQVTPPCTTDATQTGLFCRVGRRAV